MGAVKRTHKDAVFFQKRKTEHRRNVQRYPELYKWERFRRNYLRKGFKIKRNWHRRSALELAVYKAFGVSKELFRAGDGSYGDWLEKYGLRVVMGIDLSSTQDLTSRF